METYGVIELTRDQMVLIEGGKPLSYWIGYVAGFISGTITSLAAGFKDGVSGEKKE
jgi:hypothetical protein